MLLSYLKRALPSECPDVDHDGSIDQVGLRTAKVFVIAATPEFPLSASRATTKQSAALDT